MAYGNLVISTGYEIIREILLNRGITMQGFKAAELSDILLRINNNPQLIDSLSLQPHQYISI